MGGFAVGLLFGTGSFLFFLFGRVGDAEEFAFELLVISVPPVASAQKSAP